MAEVKHTPGRWIVVGPTQGKHNPNVGLWEVHGKGHVASDLTLFDARLIAAAPDLLEVVVDAISMYEHMDNAEILEFFGPRDAEFASKARAAISLATGPDTAGGGV